MFLVDFVIKNMWIWLIFGSVLSALYTNFRSKKFIEKEPDLQEGYNQLVKGELIYFNIPWVVAGIAMIFGGVPDFFDLFNPTSGNFFAIAFLSSILVLWILFIWWIYFRRGADFLAKHPGAFRPEIRSPMLIKILVGVLSATCIASLLFSGK